jgi:hypothetical protein
MFPIFGIKSCGLGNKFHFKNWQTVPFDIFEKDTLEVIVPVNLPIGPMLKNSASGKVIQMPIRSVV